VLSAILQINVNCSNLERSLAFYQMVGFKLGARLRDGANAAIDRGFGLKHSYGRGALLLLGGAPRLTRIQLIEWQRPPSRGKPYLKVNHLGLCRVVISTKDLDAEYARLLHNDVKFISEPQLLHTGAGDARFACFYDPDGTVLELIEFTPRPRQPQAT
jgi:glyoxylase I family protein